MGVSVTEDEADKRARAGWDPLAVKNKDPNFHYRWLNKNKLNMQRKQDYLGYEVVQASDAEKSGLNESTRIKKGSDAAGVVEVGDLVLARIPKEQHEAYRRENTRKIKARSQAVTQSYKNAVDRMAGGPNAFEESGDGKYSGSMDEKEFREEQGEGKLMATISVANVEVAKTKSGNSPFTLQLPEAASQTYKKGAFVTFNEAGYIVEATTPDEARIVGVASRDGQNAASAGLVNTEVWVADDDTIFVGNTNSTTSLRDRGRGYGIAKSGNNWVVDKAGDAGGAASANKRVVVLDLDPRDSVGDTNGRVHFQVFSQFRALSYTS